MTPLELNVELPSPLKLYEPSDELALDVVIVDCECSSILLNRKVFLASLTRDEIEFITPLKFSYPLFGKE